MKAVAMEAPGKAPTEPRLIRVAIDQIDDRERIWTVREWVEDADIDLLAASIRSSGDLDVPLTVRPAPDRSDFAYELILGRRRLLAARRAGRSQVHALVVDVDDSEALAAAIRADTASRQLSLLERGWALLRLRSEWDPRVYGRYRQQCLAERIGAKPPTVSEAIRSAEDVPRSMVEELARTHDFPVAHLAGLQRKAIRKIREVTTEDRAQVLGRVAAEIARQACSGIRNLSADAVTAIALDVLRQPPGVREVVATRTIILDGSGRITLDVSQPVREWAADDRRQVIEFLGPVLDEARRMDGGSALRDSGAGGRVGVWGQVFSRAARALRRWWVRAVKCSATEIFAGRTQPASDSAPSESFSGRGSIGEPTV